MLFFDHCVVGAEKSIVMKKVKDVMNASGKKVIVVCPVGIAETLICGEVGFSSHFKGQNQRRYSGHD